jgi:molecular chaperone GrpE
MNTDQMLETADGQLPENAGPAASVDEFIRELEKFEQDLHITAELKIEVSESEFDDSNLPEFIVEDLAANKAGSTAAAERSSSAAEMNFKLRQEINALEETVVRFKAERKEILDRSNRQAKDFENFRNRTERERHERMSAQMENLARQMLPVLDNLNRAVDYAAAMAPDKQAEIAPFIDGILLVNQQVHDVMSEMGVQPIVAIGEEFDPHFHEAVAIASSDELAPNTVSEEMLRGYRMGTRVLRHSMVKVTAANDTGNETRPN